MLPVFLPSTHVFCCPATSACAPLSILLQASIAKDQSQASEEPEEAPKQNPYLTGGRTAEEDEEGNAGTVEDISALEAKVLPRTILVWLGASGVW